MNDTRPPLLLLLRYGTPIPYWKTAWAEPRYCLPALPAYTLSSCTTVQPVVGLIHIISLIQTVYTYRINTYTVHPLLTVLSDHTGRLEYSVADTSPSLPTLNLAWSSCVEAHTPTLHTPSCRLGAGLPFRFGP